MLKGKNKKPQFLTATEAFAHWCARIQSQGQRVIGYKAGLDYI